MIFFWTSVSLMLLVMMVSGLRRSVFKGDMRGMRQRLVLVQREGQERVLELALHAAVINTSAA